MIPIAVLVLSLASTPVAEDHSIPYTKFVLDNGLQVIVHEDHTTPIVTICVCYHVGSAREVRGKTGLAHLFEHMLFKGSEHIPDGDHDRSVEEAGGRCQGETSRDTTYYYETLPSAYMEMGLWLESDRMGYFESSLDQSKLDNVIDVVRNERRQTLDNFPSMRAHERTLELLFPHDHPYSWDTYGSHDDLASVTLSDVRSFWRTWYGPNNATLSIGGDVNPKLVQSLVERYFGEITARPIPPERQYETVHLEEDQREIIEDVARSPVLFCCWPLDLVEGVDHSSLCLLELIIRQHLRRVLVQEGSKAESVSVNFTNSELGATFEISLKALPGGSLDSLEKDVRAQLQELFDGGIDDELVRRIRNQVRTAELELLDSNPASTLLLAQANGTCGNPNRIVELLYWMGQLTPDRLRETLRDRLIRRPRVILSLVPRGNRGLAAAPPPAAPARVDPPMSSSPLDRSRRPPSSPTPGETAFPLIWHLDLENGLSVSGITRPLSTLCSLSLRLPMGPEYEGGGTRGMLSRLALMAMTRQFGPSSQTGMNAWEDLGAEFQPAQYSDHTLLNVTFEPVHLTAVLSRLESLVRTLEFRQLDLDVMKSDIASTLHSADWSLAGGSATLHRRMYGPVSPLGASSPECRSALIDVQLEDVRTYWRDHVRPHGSALSFVGPLNADELKLALSSLAKTWNDPAPAPELSKSPAQTTDGLRIFFHRLWTSPQATIEIAQVGVLTDPRDECALSSAVQIMASGYSSRLKHRLREQLGLTYDCNAWIETTDHSSAFRCYAEVDAKQTAKALDEMMKVIAGMKDGPTPEELARLKESNRHRSLMEYAARAQCMGLLQNTHGSAQLEQKFAAWETEVESLTADQMRSAFGRCIDPRRFIVVISADSSAVCEPMTKLGLGEVIQVDSNNDPIEAAGSASNSPR